MRHLAEIWVVWRAKKHEDIPGQSSLLVDAINPRSRLDIAVKPDLAVFSRELVSKTSSRVERRGNSRRYRRVAQRYRH